MSTAKGRRGLDIPETRVSGQTIWGGVVATILLAGSVGLLVWIALTIVTGGVE